MLRCRSVAIVGPNPEPIDMEKPLIGPCRVPVLGGVPEAAMDEMTGVVRRSVPACSANASAGVAMGVVVGARRRSHHRVRRVSADLLPKELPKVGGHIALVNEAEVACCVPDPAARRVLGGRVRSHAVDAVELTAGYLGRTPSEAVRSCGYGYSGKGHARC